MDTVIIRKAPLPHHLHGVTILDANGDYNIFLNNRSSTDKQAAAFRREIENIRSEMGGETGGQEDIHL